MSGVLFNPDVDRTAVFSPCGLYRYRLGRTWDERSPVVNFLMLNPSTADAIDDDPTITRCMGFARRWYGGGIVVTNLYAFKATKPKDLWRAAEPIGPDNDATILAEAKRAGLVICAWGNHGAKNGRGDQVLKVLREAGVEPWALDITLARQPGHPLFIPANQQRRRL